MHSNGTYGRAEMGEGVIISDLDADCARSDKNHWFLLFVSDNFGLALYDLNQLTTWQRAFWSRPQM